MKKWSQQYQAASMEELLEELPAEARSGREMLRGWVRDTLGGDGSLAYYDVAWRWCESYTFRPEGSDVLQIEHCAAKTSQKYQDTCPNHAEHQHVNYKIETL